MERALRTSRGEAKRMGYDNVLIVMFKEGSSGAVTWQRKVAGKATQSRYIGILEMIKHDMLVGG